MLIQSKSNRLLVGSIISVLVSVLPVLLFYSYRYFPAEPSWDFFSFTFNSGYYQDVNTSMWVLLGKLVPLYLCVIWYFTSKNWWSKAIYGPISMYLVQIVIYFNDEIKFKDEIDGLFVVPFVILVLIMLYYTRKKLSFYISGIDLLESIENKLDELDN